MADTPLRPRPRIKEGTTGEPILEEGITGQDTLGILRSLPREDRRLVRTPSFGIGFLQ